MAEMLLSADFFYAVLRITTPVLFATLSAHIATKAGLLNIAVEGMMLLGAFSGMALSAAFGSIWPAFFIVIIFGASLGLLLGFIALYLKADIVLAGIALNIIAAGLTVFLLYRLSGDKGGSTSIQSMVMPRVEIPVIRNIPVLGTIVSNHNLFTYFGFLSTGILYVLLYRTQTGFRLRAVGENRAAAVSVGIHADRLQYLALSLSGVFAVLGGMYLSTGYLSFFTSNMSAGRGFIGFAANAMSGGSILGGTVVSLFFGFSDALANSLQSRADMPLEVIFMIPYLSVIAALVLYNSLRNRARKRTQVHSIIEQQ